MPIVPNYYTKHKESGSLGRCNCLVVSYHSISRKIIIIVVVGPVFDESKRGRDDGDRR